MLPVQRYSQSAFAQFVKSRSLLNTPLLTRSLSTANTSTEKTSNNAAKDVELPHFKMSEQRQDHFMPHPVYTREEANDVKISHLEPKTFGDKAAFQMMRMARSTFDYVTGYGKDMNEKKYLQRILFLESVAGVPGMVGGMWRHCTSLRSMSRDRGWIHTLLEEAENERMHLLTFLQMRDPGPIMRAFVLLGQGIFFNLYLVAYILAPSSCHRFVGYLEEEAVKTYTGAIEHLDNGQLKEWQDMKATKLARKYWKLSEDATLRDVLLAVRADEAIHRDVNHTFANLPKDAPNPFI